MISASRLDLDKVVDHNEWRFEILDKLDSLPHLEKLDRNGTIVLWEKIDQWRASIDSDGSVEVNRQISEAKSHIALVFHRFLSGGPGQKVTKRVEIKLNNDLSM